MTNKTVAEQWQASASGWARWAALGAEYLVPATERMLDLADVRPGARVLDVGCGSGEQTVIAARRVGNSGHVLATDIAAPMVAAAGKTVAAAGLHNVSTSVRAAEALAELSGEPFDAAISRLVLMLIPDPVAAARAVRGVLKPGGRFAVIVPGDQAKTGFNNVALDILARHGGRTDWETRPGSIRSLVDPDRLALVLRDAGFEDVSVSAMKTVQRMESAAATTTMIREGFAFYKGLIADLSPDGQAAAWEEVERALRQFEGPEGFAGPSEVNLAVGTRPGG